MSADGFQASDKDEGYDPAVAARFFQATEWLADRLHVEVEGIEHLPEGRALLVANHAFGWDVAFAMSRIRRLTGRPVWALGEHAWWRVPWLRKLAAAVGTVDGCPANADRLLSADELVLVLPGGLREAVKPRELRYRLLWGNRYGFIRAAMRNSAPIVPLVSFGADEMFDFVGNAFDRGNRWIRHRGFPIPLPARILPIPHRVKLRFVIGEPIPMGPVAGNDLTDAAHLRRCRREVEGALHEIIERELARRVGISLSEDP